MILNPFLNLFLNGFEFFWRLLAPSRFAPHAFPPFPTPTKPPKPPKTPNPPPTTTNNDEQPTNNEQPKQTIFNKSPTFVTDYPRGIKAFYMRGNEDGKTVAAMDLLVPKV